MRLPVARGAASSSEPSMLASAWVTARQTATAVRRLARERDKVARAKAAQRKKDERCAMRKLLPEYMTGIEKEIAAARHAGKREAHFYVHGGVYDNVQKAVEKKLKAKKYTVMVDYREFDSDYGDFNAPCVMHESSTTFIIKW
jgi:hypothetical protein